MNVTLSLSQAETYARAYSYFWEIGFSVRLIRSIQTGARFSIYDIESTVSCGTGLGDDAWTFYENDGLNVRIMPCGLAPLCVNLEEFDRAWAVMLRHDELLLSLNDLKNSTRKGRFSEARTSRKLFEQALERASGFF